MRKSIVVCLLAVAALLSACPTNGSTVISCAVGSESCACTPGGACDDGLSCYSGLCVNTDGDVSGDVNKSDVIVDVLENDTDAGELDTIALDAIVDALPDVIIDIVADAVPDNAPDNAPDNGPGDCTVLGCSLGKTCDSASGLCIDNANVATCGECSAAADCAAGGDCIPVGGQNVCASPCATSDGCETGWTCFSSRCVPAGFSCEGCATDGCGANQACETNANGACAAQIHTCDSCVDDWECGPGNACRDTASLAKRCVPRCNDTSDCPANSGCDVDPVSGYKTCVLSPAICETIQACPTAVISVQEGDEVIPHTQLHLVGSSSYAGNGAVASYAWSVVQPPGSVSVFLPSASAPDPTFNTNVAGPYTFRLTVTDSNGETNCVQTEFHVAVIPDTAIHIELLWSTPGDPDESDTGPGAGADVDLHFVHPSAVGTTDVDGDGQNEPWFDEFYDAYWFSTNPNWGSFAPAADDDPYLRDDSDGAGPETLSLNVPENGLSYKIGVHYFDDHQFGPSSATIRVYVFSVLVFQIEGVELVADELWEAATIDWPSGMVTPITSPGGGYKIFADYPKF